MNKNSKSKLSAYAFLYQMREGESFRITTDEKCNFLIQLRFLTFSQCLLDFLPPNGLLPNEKDAQIATRKTKLATI